MKTILTSIALSALFLVHSFAQAEPQKEKLEIFGGLGVGYSTLSADDFTSVSGYKVAAGAIVSYYRNLWVYDIGLGWFRNSLSGKVLSGLNGSVAAQGISLGLSARYRLGEGGHWQLGPVLDLDFATSLGYTPLDPNADPSVRLLGGAKVAYEFNFEKFDLRLFLKPQTDFSKPTRRNYVAMAGIEIGFPVYKNEFDSTPPPEAKPVETFYEVPLNALHFASNSAKLDQRSKKYLHDLGSVLAKNLEIWQAMRISGHTDLWGEDDYNHKLSARRAEAVLQELHSSGVPKDRILEIAAGKTQPVDTRRVREAYAKNRRVELLFLGVSNKEKLMSEIKDIKLEE